MSFVYKGEEIPTGGIPGPAGPDGNPIGTVISYLGRTAPGGYLICDGAEYSVSAYPALAEFFKQQFGTANCFGGNGTTTFAVPDMRNLFLRGYHGEAEEPLSGEIGAKQAATEHTTVLYQSNPGRITIFTNDAKEVNTPKEADKYQETASKYYNTQIAGPGSGFQLGSRYTSRPVNMAVLYCIKA